MKASTICSTIISMAVVATAIPTADVAIEARTDKTIGEASNTCNANQVVSCCNTSTKQTSVGGILSPVLALLGLGSALSGNSCSGLSVPVLSGILSSSASSVCGADNSVQCCGGDKQTGFINVNLGVLECSQVL
ncbi:hypothetical protein BFW01_g4609 [Lasiodiplodia theobromae]|nr:hypothetical protein BFW01_g4609 [Lasiodiplodia theobromae]